MDWVYAVILGLIEGATEFIPVSSTGHLLLAKQLMGLGPAWDTFIVLIQLGAILSVVVIYAARFWSIALRLPHDAAARKFVLSVIVAFLPAAVLGVVLHDFIKRVLFESPTVICASLLIGGIVLLLLDRIGKSGRWRDAFAVPLGTAFGIGLIQCLAMIPGVSRSGATIAGGLLLGCEKRAAAEFSFFLAIPTMAGAFAYDLYKNSAAITAHDGGLIAVGFITAFLSGLLVVKLFLDIVGRLGFAPFAWWRIAVGAIGLVVLHFHGGLHF
ncbi:MAG: undecaprenyl-diphosphate phosphatase [Caulobacteraceae bacterium]